LYTGGGNSFSFCAGKRNDGALAEKEEKGKKGIFTFRRGKERERPFHLEEKKKTLKLGCREEGEGGIREVHKGERKGRSSFLRGKEKKKKKENKKKKKNKNGGGELVPSCWPGKKKQRSD